MCSTKINYATAKTTARVELRAFVSSHQQLLMCKRNRKNKPTNLGRLVVKVVLFFAKKNRVRTGFLRFDDTIFHS
jgi:hypothetical protein